MNVFQIQNNLKSIHLINLNFQLCVCVGSLTKHCSILKKLFDKINYKIVSIEKQKLESISCRNSLWDKKKSLQEEDNSHGFTDE